MKRSSMGGIDPTSPTTKLNIWVCVLDGRTLGYAQFPGGNPLTDGIVITTSAFGSKEKYPQGYYKSGYDRGRTLVHELGHWFNLYHVWGPSSLGADDLVADTAPQSAPSYECFTPVSGSDGVELPPRLNLNYMDYLEDGCTWMFTEGQKSRMLATFTANGPRSSFLR